MNKKQILSKILNSPSYKNPAFWKKQYRLLNALLKKFPDLEFWKSLNVNKVNCLTLYCGENLYELQELYKKFIFQPEFKNPEINIGEKVGEDYNKTNKPRNIKQFLK